MKFFMLPAFVGSTGDQQIVEITGNDMVKLCDHSDDLQTIKNFNVGLDDIFCFRVGLQLVCVGVRFNIPTVLRKPYLYKN